MSTAASTTDMQILQRIGSTARAFAALTRRSITSASSPSATPSPSVSTPLTFPSPQNISPALVSLGLRLPIAEKISNAYQRTSTEYRAHALAQCKRTLPSLARDDPRGRLYVERLMAQYVSTMVTKYLQVLHGWQEGILQTVSSRIQIIRDSRQPAHTSDKRPFSQAVISTLETYFEKDPRPSRSEKQRIAGETELDYKQVGIWFQNRRTRHKKSSTPQADNARTTPLPIDLARSLLAILDRYAPIPDEEEKPVIDRTPSFAPFNSVRPAHAFPVCFPPMCAYDPFPIDRDIRAFSTPWLRYASPLPRARTCGDDTSDVSTLLQKLSIQAEEAEAVDSGRPLSKPCTDVHIGFTLTPPPAPLPALHTPTPSSPVSPQRTQAKRSSIMSALVSSKVASKVKSYAARLGSAARKRCLSRKSTLPPSGTMRSASEPSRGRTQLGAQLSVAHGSQRPHGDESVAPTLGPAFVWHPYPRGKPVSSSSRLPQRCATQVFDNEFNPLFSTAQPTLQSDFPASSLVPIRSLSRSPLSSWSASSRESSVASIRSVSSLTSISSSSADSELLLTPPLVATTLPDLHESKDSTSFGLYADADGLPSIDVASPYNIEDDYMGYSSMLPHADDVSLASAFLAILESRTSLLAEDHFVRPLNAPIAVF